MRGMALHVFKVEKVLAPLCHLPKVWQQVQQLVEFVLKWQGTRQLDNKMLQYRSIINPSLYRNTLVAVHAVVMKGSSHLVVAILHMTSVSQSSHGWT